MSKTVYISFSAEINALTSQHLIATLAQQANDGVEHVYLLLSTQGGGVTDGFNLYNSIRAMPFRLTVHNVGSVNSIGNVLFLAAEENERYACQHSTFMFHGVGYDIPQGTRLEQKGLGEFTDALIRDQERIANLLTERSKIESAEAAELFKEARTKDVTFALNKGIIHKISDVKIPKGIPILAFVFQK